MFFISSGRISTKLAFLKYSATCLDKKPIDSVSCNTPMLVNVYKYSTYLLEMLT